MISNSSTFCRTPLTLVPGSNCMSITRFRIRALRAVDEPHTCLVFIKKHREILKFYNLEMITSNTDDWSNNPNVYVLVAESMSTGEMIGGARIHIAKPEFPLPIEGAVSSVEPKIIDLIKQYSSCGGVGELCGLWNSLHHKKIGLSVRLCRAAIAIINQLKFTTLMAIVGRATLQGSHHVGFVENKMLGDKGTFPYPKKDMLAWALGVLNSKTLETARPSDKKIILELRKKNKQLRKEQVGRSALEIDYQLSIDTLGICSNENEIM